MFLLGKERLENMFKITEYYPTPILQDFSAFMDYLQRVEGILTAKNQHLSKKFLWVLNQQVSLKVENATPGLDQASYPLFHMFYHLSLAGKLTIMVPDKGGKFKLKVTDRYQDYLKLTTAEKYFFLLETLWIDTDWQALNEASYSLRFNEYAIANVWEQLIKSESNKTLNLQSKDSKWHSLLWNFGYFLYYFY